MAGLSDKLDELGLSAYHDAFVREGFDTWDTVLDITESDLYVMPTTGADYASRFRALDDETTNC
jgi:hypothetical protein